MYEKLEECPSCKHPQFNNFKICKDHSVSGESFALVKCSKCQLVFTNPRPVIEEIHKYYNSSTYISHTNKGNTLVNILYKIARVYTLRRKLKAIRKFTPRKRILDYGCGTGHFLQYLTSKGWETYGFEPDEGARASATSQNLTVFDNRARIKELEKFDVITLWHVLEHVHDVRDTMKFLRKRLESNGFLFIAVPNINSFDAIHYHENWAAYDVPRHLYHFSQDSFSRLAKKCKFNIVDILPMKLDAFYVSMLSEKYKGNQNALLDGLRLGRRSNKNASLSKEYSSLIYVLSK